MHFFRGVLDCMKFIYNICLLEILNVLLWGIIVIVFFGLAYFSNFFREPLLFSWSIRPHEIYLQHLLIRNFQRIVMGNYCVFRTCLFFKLFLRALYCFQGKCCAFLSWSFTPWDQEIYLRNLFIRNSQRIVMENCCVF